MDCFDLNFTRDEVETLYYACAQAEMMWRKRSHAPLIDSESSYADSPEEFEVECRAEMKRYRVMQKALESQLPDDFWSREDFSDGTGPIPTL